MKLEEIKRDGKDMEIEVTFADKKEEKDFEQTVKAIMNDFLDTLGDIVNEEDDKVGCSIHLEDEIEKVTFNNPATVVFWKDGTKTVSKCKNGDTFNKETGLAMCIIRKLCRNRNYNAVFEKYCR